MSRSRAQRWIAMFGFLVAGCGSDAAARRTQVAPVAEAAPPVAPAAATAPTAQPPVVESAPAEPPAPPAPEVVLPPCPTDPRDGEQLPDHVVQLVTLSDAMTVVDLGSGSGYFLCRLSRAVGPRGHVIATEIDKQLVGDLGKRIAREHLANVEVVLAPPNDVGIAPGTADRILLVNVWHHLVDRKRYAARIVRALAPGGKVIVVDFKPGGRHGAGHGIAPETVLAELTAGGIDGALVPEDLPDQYVVVGTVRPPRASR
jgi:SAM-dependent methyltransferase